MPPPAGRLLRCGAVARRPSRAAPSAERGGPRESRRSKTPHHRGPVGPRTPSSPDHGGAPGCRRRRARRVRRREPSLARRAGRECRAAAPGCTVDVPGPVPEARRTMLRVLLVPVGIRERSAAGSDHFCEGDALRVRDGAPLLGSGIPVAAQASGAPRWPSPVGSATMAESRRGRHDGRDVPVRWRSAGRGRSSARDGRGASRLTGGWA